MPLKKSANNAADSEDPFSPKSIAKGRWTVRHYIKDVELNGFTSVRASIA